MVRYSRSCSVTFRARLSTMDLPLWLNEIHQLIYRTSSKYMYIALRLYLPCMPINWYLSFSLLSPDMTFEKKRRYMYNERERKRETVVKYKCPWTDLIFTSWDAPLHFAKEKKGNVFFFLHLSYNSYGNGIMVIPHRVSGTRVLRVSNLIFSFPCNVECPWCILSSPRNGELSHTWARAFQVEMERNEKKEIQRELR